MPQVLRQGRDEMTYRCEDEALEHTTGVYVEYGTCSYCSGEGCERCDLSGAYERLEFEDVREVERAEWYDWTPSTAELEPWWYEVAA